jgi:hypothetical protein
VPLVRLYYRGGPCDARSVQVEASTLTGGVVRCRGARYIVQGESARVYRATWDAQNTAEEQAPSLATGTQFDRAWHGLMEVLAFKVPAELARQRAAVRRIRGAVR